MEKKTRDWEKIMELVVVIMLGVTALLTAWASWIGSLHGGNQATNYATSNNLASEGNSEYNAGVQKMSQDMLLWNDISAMQIEIIFADSTGDDVEVSKVSTQLYYKIEENLSGAMADKLAWTDDLRTLGEDDPVAAITQWMEIPESMVSPFFDDAYIDTYFETAEDLLAQSQSVLDQGRSDNAHGDAFGLVTVIYSVVLFLLGIAGSFKSVKNKYAVIAISVVAFIFATVYMCTLPLPTGFGIVSYFTGV